MFDIGFPELLVVSIVALLILGPERLPEALRTLGLWMGRLRRSFTAVKSELEKELGMDDIRRQLHNESVMEEMQRIEAEVQNSLDAEATAAPTAVQESEAKHSIAPPSLATPDTAADSATDSISDTTTNDTNQAPTNQPADVTDDHVNKS